MEVLSRKSQFPQPGGPKAPGLVYAFVPAHGQTKAGAITAELCRTFSESYGLSVLLADFCARGFPIWGTAEAPQCLNGQNWTTFVTAGEPCPKLEAREAHPREIPELLDNARREYAVTCADLTASKEISALEVLRHADSIFVLSDSDPGSLELARYKVAWLRMVGLGEKTGLLLSRVGQGVTAREAEERTGLPVCAMVDTTEEFGRLAAWLVAARRSGCPEQRRAAG